MHRGEEHRGNQFTSGRFLPALDVCTPICVREHICVHMDHWIYEPAVYVARWMDALPGYRRQLIQRSSETRIKYS